MRTMRNKNDVSEEFVIASQYGITVMEKVPGGYGKVSVHTNVPSYEWGLTHVAVTYNTKRTGFRMLAQME